VVQLPAIDILLEMTALSGYDIKINPDKHFWLEEIEF